MKKTITAPAARIKAARKEMADMIRSVRKEGYKVVDLSGKYPLIGYRYLCGDYHTDMPKRA